MKKTIYMMSAMAVVSLGLLASACDNKKDKKDTSHLPGDVRLVAEAILEDSPQKFAAVVSYPVERPYPLKNINDSAEMVEYYPKLIDKKLKEAVVDAPDSMWNEAGWRGWTLGNGGYFYIDSGKIYEMNYVSDQETVMLDSLRHEEITSLKSSLQPGWIPVMCVIDTISNAVFRIDSQEETNPPIYRLSGYAATTDLSDTPNLLLYGHLDLDGSMGNRFYEFSDSLGSTTAYYSPDIVSDDDQPAIEVDRNGTMKRYPAIPDYWLDLLKKRKATLHFVGGDTIKAMGDDGVEGRSLHHKTTKKDSVQLPQSNNHTPTINDDGKS